MSASLELSPKRKRPAGERCECPPARPDISARNAERVAALAKALSDPVRVQLIDVLRSHPGKLCPCELVPLFDLAQPTVSHHLKVLRDARVIGCRKQGLFAYYYPIPGGLDDLAEHLATKERP